MLIASAFIPSFPQGDIDEKPNPTASINNSTVNIAAIIASANTAFQLTPEFCASPTSCKNLLIGLLFAIAILSLLIKSIFK